jgi:hypothetical protein
MSRMTVSELADDSATYLANRFLEQFEGTDSLGRLFAECVVYLDAPQAADHSSSGFDTESL